MSAGLKDMLEVFIGLSLLYLTLSLLVSTVGEFVSQLFALRANTLYDGIESLVGSKTAAGLYKHDLVRALTKEGFWDRWVLSRIPGLREFRKQRPSYLGSKLFSTVIMELALAPPSAAESARVEVAAHEPIALTTQKLQAAIQQLPDAVARKSANALLHEAMRRAADSKELLAEFQAGLERWFDTDMERVTGWYKRNIQFALLVIGLLLAIAINADSLSVARTLYRNDEARNAAVEAASRIVEADVAAKRTEALPPDLGEALDVLAKRVTNDATTLKDAGLPLGWNQIPAGGDVNAWLLRVAGWVITAVMLSLGAPFWFDLLGKLMKLRAAGEKPLPGAAEASDAARP